MMSWIYHGMTGNGAAETQVAWNRGGFAAAILGITNAVLIVVPIDEVTKTALVASLNPTIGFLSYMGFAFLDKWLKNKGVK